jgi:hypothetical protein
VTQCRCGRAQEILRPQAAWTCGPCACENPHSDARITFIQSDCAGWLEATARSNIELPRPRLLVEDFHGELSGFFEHIDSILTAGDYLVIEDSNPKQSAIAQTIAGLPYAVDTKYTDFFGINCTSAINSIFVKRA